MRKLFLLIALALCSSCKPSTKKDIPGDKAAAEAVVSKFFDFRKQKDEQKMYSLFSERFYKKNDSNYIKTTLKENEELYGKITSIKLRTSTSSKYSWFFKERGHAFLAYKIESEKGKWNESYGLTLKDGVFKINTFRVRYLNTYLKK